MPRGLDSADRKLLIGAGMLFAILVVVAAMVSRPQANVMPSAPSTYSASWDGAEGAFLLLQQLGYNVSRWEQSPAQLPEDSANKVLILADPTELPSEEERYDIIEFLEKGGKVIATGATAGEFLPQASEFAEGNPLDPKQTFGALLPSAIVRGAPQITMAVPEGWSPDSVRQVAVYGDHWTPAVITYQFGKGEVIWWAAPTPLTNGAILDSDNLTFFLNCVGSPGQAEIFWDEYFHGVRGSLAEFFMRTPVVWGAAQFALVFLAILATYSRRLGPVRAPVTPSRLSPLEFVDTLGDLYASAHVSAAALGTAYQRLRFTLTRRLGLPLDVLSKELAAAASESFGWDEAQLLDVLVRCDLAKEAPKGKVENPLVLFQEIHDYAERLEVKRTTTKEGKRNE
ncbi:MAG TPA: DUF4350 domain-containing protein [Candidatus Aquilonibacter sp.]|nr:DUF4350 domain-containing protein [Candidatus Aquilonibacter sp.]